MLSSSTFILLLTEHLEPQPVQAPNTSNVFKLFKALNDNHRDNGDHNFTFLFKVLWTIYV
jgi:hypothetical protein